MLKDLPEDWRAPQEQFLVMLRELNGGHQSQPVRVYRGVYLAHINFDKELDATGLLVNHWPEGYAAVWQEIGYVEEEV